MQLVNEEDDIQTHVLLPGENLVWHERTSMPSEAKLAILSSVVLSALFLFIMGMCSLIIGSTPPFLLVAFIFPVLLLVFLGAYTFYINLGTHLNVITDARVLTCLIKHGSHVVVKCAPLSAIDSVDALANGTLIFTMKFNDKNVDYEDDMPQNRRRAPILKLEKVRDTNEVDRIVRDQMKRNPENTITFDDSLWKPSSSSYMHKNWPAAFQKLINSALIYSDEDPNRLIEESNSREEIIWSHKSSIFSLWLRFFIVFVLLEVISISLGSVAKLAWVWLLATAISLVSVYLSMNLAYVIRQAYVITNKSILLLRTGFPTPRPIPPDVILNDGINHCIKIDFDKAFPLVLSHKIKGGSGEISFISQNLPQVKLYAPDIKTLGRMIFEGYQRKTSKKEPTTLDPPSEESNFQIE